MQDRRERRRRSVIHNDAAQTQGVQGIFVSDKRIPSDRKMDLPALGIPRRGLRVTVCGRFQVRDLLRSDRLEQRRENDIPGIRRRRNSDRIRRALGRRRVISPGNARRCRHKARRNRILHDQVRKQRIQAHRIGRGLRRILLRIRRQSQTVLDHLDEQDIQSTVSVRERKRRKDRPGRRLLRIYHDGSQR